VAVLKAIPVLDRRSETVARRYVSPHHRLKGCTSAYAYVSMGGVVAIRTTATKAANPSSEHVTRALS
jgi:hypothetical protein